MSILGAVSGYIVITITILAGVYWIIRWASDEDLNNIPTLEEWKDGKRKNR